MSKRPKAHPNDILLIGQAWERQAWPEFDDKQVIQVDDYEHIYGRLPRRAYVTSYAGDALRRNQTANEQLGLKLMLTGTRIIDAGCFEPHVEPKRSLVGRAARWFEDTFIFTKGR